MTKQLKDIDYFDSLLNEVQNKPERLSGQSPVAKPLKRKLQDDISLEVLPK